MQLFHIEVLPGAAAHSLPNQQEFAIDFLSKTSAP
jgi:hypothetical protein